MLNPIPLVAPFVFAFLLMVCNLQADIVTDSTPTGTTDRNGNNDFVGLLDSVGPDRIGGQNINLNGSAPTGESSQIGDLVGRDIDATGGSRTWEYLLILPADAVSGTGFTSISFSGHAYERSSDNLEGSDQIRWSLYLNSDVTPVQVSGPVAGTDWSTFDVNLSDPGGNSITSVRVVFEIIGFDDDDDWFVTRGSLQASYQKVPEPGCVVILLLVLAASNTRRFK